jgi:transposase
VAHGRRCLNVYGRQVLVERIVHRGWSVTAADGVATSQIARDLGLSRPTVRLWRQRFRARGPTDLTEIQPGRGCPST